MSILTPTISSSSFWGAADVPEAPVFRLTVQQYHEMIRTGVLMDGDPVELLEGWLIQKMSKNPPHVVAAQITAAALSALAIPGWCVRNENPITLGDSEPEPDVVIARGTQRDYLQRHPSPTDLALVVEVADSSLPIDRGLKYRIFARAMIECYWIVNLVDRQIEVYTRPTGPTQAPTYAERQNFREGASIPLIIAGKVIAQLPVNDLLP